MTSSPEPEQLYNRLLTSKNSDLLALNKSIKFMEKRMYDLKKNGSIYGAASL